jgi:biopolymer transport protein ExbB/TolQ
MDRTTRAYNNNNNILLMQMRVSYVRDRGRIHKKKEKIKQQSRPMTMAMIEQENISKQHQRAEGRSAKSGKQKAEEPSVERGESKRSRDKGMKKGKKVLQNVSSVIDQCTKFW